MSKGRKIGTTSAMSKAARAELEAIRVASGGFLKPKDVVDHARNEASALHRMFEWNDGKAAEAYRLSQANNLIRVSVVVSEQTGEPIRAFVSLSEDRYKGRGYRASVDVMSDAKLFAMLLEDAKRELEAFYRKYEKLKVEGELTGVFSAIEDEVTVKTKKGKKEEARPAV